MPEAAFRLARIALAAAALLLIGADRAPDRSCSALAELRIPDLAVESAAIISGAFAAPDGTRVTTVPLCRVRAVARPVPQSRITFELWMPVSGWNGRYYQLGNGGFAGNIHIPSLAAEAARGNAAAITDTGHQGHQFDASWAAGHPERIIDYGHRSIKAASDSARALLQAYYGRSAHHHYFAGCSNGGRQALIAAQRYPEDWDGIIAGAPAAHWTSQLESFAALQQHLRADPRNWLTVEKLPLIQRAALASCPRGTVTLGVAGNPQRCHFDPRRLLCRQGSGADCLSAAQLESLHRIQAAGFDPTSAATADNWQRWILNRDETAPSQLTFATQAFRYLLQHRPDWRVGDYDPRRDRVAPELRALIDASSTDLSGFRARGGRIISYFGWADAVIAPERMVDHYRETARRMGSVERLRGFYRLFPVPGMTHCQGGPVPDSFGQSLSAPALSPDPRHDIRAALEAWVERGVAPQELVAVRIPPADLASSACSGRCVSAYRCAVPASRAATVRPVQA